MTWWVKRTPGCDMTILDINNVTKFFGPRVVLSQVSFKVNKAEKVGLIGENGSGKSTLLKMIVGEESIDEGVIAVPGKTGIGHLAQHLSYGADNTVLEEIMSVFDHLKTLESELQEAEAEMATLKEVNLEKGLARYSRLAERFEREGGYQYEHKSAAVIEGLRITRLTSQQMDSLSGGEKNIVALAKVLLEEPEILLLDEPANHLDFEGLAWLEEFLKNCEQTVILVSHNRYLLDRVVGRIVELEDCGANTYPGNYSSYRARKMRDLIKQKAAYEDQQKEIQRLEEMVKRFEHWAHITDNARHARQARNKQKVIDRMDRIDRPGLDRGKIDPSFDFADRTGKIALELKKYSKRFGDKVLFEDVDLSLTFGDRVGLLGANGTGKSTLFKEIMADGAWDNSVIRVGPRTKIGYYSQEHETLEFSRTILEEIPWESGLTKDQGFTALSRFLFDWEDLDKRIGTLSGGEKSRVQLAKLMVADVNFLLMDEPTNHLDIPSREQVEEALDDFEGTMLVISHDRYFLDRIVSRVVEISNPDLILEFNS
jgi:ATP-binding cassette subfamily F protein 3